MTVFARAVDWRGLCSNKVREASYSVPSCPWNFIDDSSPFQGRQAFTCDVDVSIPSYCWARKARQTFLPFSADLQIPAIPAAPTTVHASSPQLVHTEILHLRRGYLHTFNTTSPLYAHSHGITRSFPIHSLSATTHYRYTTATMTHKMLFLITFLTMLGSLFAGAAPTGDSVELSTIEPGYTVVDLEPTPDRNYSGKVRSPRSFSLNSA